MNSLFDDDTRSLAERLRMAASFGVAAGVLGGLAGRVFWHVPEEELKPLLMRAVDDVLGLD